jgi:hypothetical protein
MAYDAAAKKHILFGTQFDDDKHTWAFDLRTNSWADLEPKAVPPTDRNDPVLAYDPNGRRVVTVVRAIDKTDGKEPTAGHVETWAYDTAANTWARLNPPREPDGWGNRRRVMVAAPELNALVLEAFVNPTERVKGVDREQQIWTYRFAPADPSGLPAPANVRVRTEKDAAAVQWERVTGADGYVVLRGVGQTPWTAEFKPVGKTDLRGTEFVDREVPRGRVAYYRVKAVARDGTEGEPSPVVRTQPRVADDPLVCVTGPTSVRVEWPLYLDDVRAYHVERAPVEVFTEDQILRLKKDTPPLAEPSVGAVKRIGKFERLTKEPAKVSGPAAAGITYGTFTDTTIDLTKPTKVEGEATYTHRFRDDQLDPNGKPYRFGVYAYRVVAVNALGVEGGPSAWTLTIPEAVQHVFAKEDGERCHLKWAANRDGTKGYRVYRMESPRINGPGQPVTRLTSDPVVGTTFTDEKATKETKRYWVVAVDAMGQEGVPSAPVWHQRQYRKFYEPFTGEWHQ